MDGGEVRQIKSDLAKMMVNGKVITSLIVFFVVMTYGSGTINKQMCEESALRASEGATERANECCMVYVESMNLHWIAIFMFMDASN